MINVLVSEWHSTHSTLPWMRDVVLIEMLLQIFYFLEDTLTNPANEVCELNTNNINLGKYISTGTVLKSQP